MLGRSRMMRGTLALFALGAGCAHGQTLKTRGAIESPELKAVYEAPEYETFYAAAEKAYVEAKPEQALVPVAWDSRKPMLWLVQSQRQILAYVKSFEALKHELDAAAEDRQLTNSAERVAEISLIEDRLTADNVTALNVLVKSLDMGTLFIGNHRSGIAQLWVVRTVPESAHRLNGAKMGEVVGFLDDVNACLSESTRDHMVYAKSASFSADVPKDENDKPLTRQQADIFWQAYTHAPLDKAIAELYGSLRRAEAVVRGNPGTGTTEK